MSDDETTNLFLRSATPPNPLSPQEREMLKQLQERENAGYLQRKADRVSDEKERVKALVAEGTQLASGDPVAFAVLKLHSPTVDKDGCAGCDGCECSCSSEWGRDAAYWPCGTWELVIKTLHEQAQP